MTDMTIDEAVTVLCRRPGWKEIAARVFVHPDEMARSVVLAHAKATLAARAEEHYAVKYLREVVAAEGDDPEVTRGEAEHIIAHIDTLAAQLAEARHEIERMARDHAEYVAGRVGIKDFAVRDGRWNMTLHTDMALIMADSLSAMLDGHEAENYVEASLRGSDGKAYTMRVQRGDKPTPHDLRLKAEADRDTARAALAAMRERVLACEPYTVSPGTHLSCTTDGLDDFWIPNKPAVVFSAYDVRAAVKGGGGNG